MKHTVVETDPSAELILFGSQARGDAHEESDWDVLVITGETVTPEHKSKGRQKLYEVQLTSGIAIGSLFINRKKWGQPTAMPVYLEIRKEGIPL